MAWGNTKKEQPTNNGNGEPQQQMRSRFQQMLHHLHEACAHLDKAATLSSATTQQFETLLRHVYKIGADLTKAIGEEASRAEVESYKESKSKSQSSSSSSSSTTLGDLINWKRENQ